MMAQAYKSPGVYREEVLLKPAPVLQTGVPGFIGFADLVAGDATNTNQPVLLNRKDDFAVHFTARADSFLFDAVNGFFDNGGDHCYVMRADPAAGAAGLQDAILGLAPLNDLDLVAAPDIMTLRSGLGGPDKESIGRVQSALLSHCAELGNRLAILDALPGSAVSDVLDQRKGLVSSQLEPVRGALYYPWLLTSSPRLVPPCGHVAGIFSSTDAKAGVYKAPANEEVLSVLDLEKQIDNVVQDQLNPEGINCLRAFPGRGIRVWGARTISRDPNWRYVNVQRLFMTLRRWIDMNMGWAAFEPNEQHLWIRIQRELSAYLSRLLSAGALRGATAAEAFYVKCDAENNPAEVRDAGQVIIEVGLAPQSPAEFIVVRITWRAGATADG
jgi:phage tail sheath protein FI